MLLNKLRLLIKMLLCVLHGVPKPLTVAHVIDINVTLLSSRVLHVNIKTSYIWQLSTERRVICCTFSSVFHLSTERYQIDINLLMFY